MTFLSLKKDYITPVGRFEEILLDEEKTVRLILTGKCNLACEFCAYKIRDFYSPEVHSDKLIEMRPTKKLEKILIEMNKELNYCIAHLTGGEPTIAKNIVAIANLSKNIGYSINMCSNLIYTKSIIELLETNSLSELTFSYLPPDSENQRRRLPSYKRPDRKRIKKITKSITDILSKFPNLSVKTNIIISPYSDLDDVVDFIYWCWNNGINPRMQRDRSSNRILGSTETTNELLQRLNVNGKRVILKIPGATEVCEFQNSDKKSLFVKIFNKNFRPQEICNLCGEKATCSKSLSSIRIYDTKEEPILCFCTQHNERFAHLKIEKFLESRVFEEIKGYKKNKKGYFEKFCTFSNFQ